MTGDSVPRKLVKLVRSVQDECWPLAENEAPIYVPPEFLFRDGIHAHLDLSPRATRSMRSFQTPNERRAFLGMLKNDLKWLVQTFALVQKAKLVILLGKVIDERDNHGIGLREFLSTHAPDDFWNRTLPGRRWPKNACSKSQLAHRVFCNRKALLDFLRRN